MEITETSLCVLNCSLSDIDDFHFIFARPWHPVTSGYFQKWKKKK